MNCARCDRALSPTLVDGVELDTCPSCHGAWLDHGELCRFLAHAFRGLDPQSVDTVLVGATVAHPDLQPGARCPYCATPLLAARLGYEGLHADLARCILCRGVWMDGAEVARARASRERWQQAARKQEQAWRDAVAAEAQKAAAGGNMASAPWEFLLVIFSGL